jgi:hypothetical protein
VYKNVFIFKFNHSFKYISNLYILLERKTIGVRSAAEVKDSSSSSAPTPALTPAHPPIQWVPGVLSPWAKHGRGMTLTTHPISAEVKND